MRPKKGRIPYDLVDGRDLEHLFLLGRFIMALGQVREEGNPESG